MAPALNFWADQEGQDLIEYTLLMAFIVITCLALIVNGRPAISGIWNSNMERLNQASEATGG